MTDYANTFSSTETTIGRTATLYKINNNVNQLLDLVHKLVNVNNNKFGFIKKKNLPDHAQDIFQSTVVKVIEKADHYDCNQPFEAWFSYWAILEIRHSHQKTNGRSRSKTVHLKSGIGADEYPINQKNPAERDFQPIHLAEVTAIILTRIRSILNEKDYQLFLAKNLHFLENGEIASTLGITKTQVAVKATRIMKKVRKELTQQDWHDFQFGSDKPFPEKQPVRTGAKP